MNAAPSISEWLEIAACGPHDNPWRNPHPYWRWARPPPRSRSESFLLQQGGDRFRVDHHLLLEPENRSYSTPVVTVVDSEWADCSRLGRCTPGIPGDYSVYSRPVRTRRSVFTPASTSPRVRFPWDPYYFRNAPNTSHTHEAGVHHKPPTGPDGSP